MNLFKKLPVTLSVAAALTLALSAPVFAGNGNQEGSNGKPFQELRDLIESNRTLIDANQGDISQLKATVSSLSVSVDSIIEHIKGIESNVSQNSVAITAAMQKISNNADDITALRNELVTVHQQVLAKIDTVKSDLTTLSSNISTVLEQLRTATVALQTKLAELEQAVELNAVGVDGLQMQVVSLVSQISTLNAQSNSLTWQYQGLNTRMDEMDAQLPEFEAQILSLQEAVVILEENSEEEEPVEPTPCYTLNNTSSIDQTGNNWFDACVDAQGEQVKVVLKDLSGNEVYSQTGHKTGHWSYDRITSDYASYYQYLLRKHDRAITLSNGDKLMVSGRNSSGSGCQGDLGAGYVVSIYSQSQTTSPKMVVAPYNRNGASYGGRSIGGWSQSTEISWDNDKPMQTCTYGMYSPQIKGLIGTFEFYVY